MTDSPAEDGTAAVRPVPFISRVRLKNYKSIAECDVSLGPLTILVGPNGSALTEASGHVQVLATSQSSDLLDRDDLDASVIRPVTMHDGLTLIGEVDDASRENAEKKLYTLGELMRGNQLTPKLPQAGGVAADGA
jgi:hypothetical protein